MILRNICYKTKISFCYVIATITIIVYSDSTSSPDGQRKTGTWSLPAAPASQGSPLASPRMGVEQQRMICSQGCETRTSTHTDTGHRSAIGFGRVSWSNREWIISRMFKPFLFFSLSLSFDFPPTAIRTGPFSKILEHMISQY